MKQLIAITCILALVFTACKKEETSKPVSPTNSISTDNRLTALPKPESIPNGTSKTVGVTICPGIYYYPLGGDVTQGSCFPSSNVCFIVVSALGNGTTTITSNFSATYPPNTAQATIYTTPSQQFYITSLNVTFNGPNANVKMVRQ